MFICDYCIYETKYKSNYTKHLKTKKHSKLLNRHITLKNTTDDNDCFIGCPPTKNDIDNLIKGFYSRKSTVYPDAPPTAHENYKEKTNGLILKYNNIYRNISQEITNARPLSQKTTL